MVETLLVFGFFALMFLVGLTLYIQQVHHKELMATLEAFATMVGDLLEKRSRDNEDG